MTTDTRFEIEGSSPAKMLTIYKSWAERMHVDAHETTERTERSIEADVVLTALAEAGCEHDDHRLQEQETWLSALNRIGVLADALFTEPHERSAQQMATLRVVTESVNNIRGQIVEIQNMSLADLRMESKRRAQPKSRRVWALRGRKQLVEIAA